jgi:hypothetical protein
MAAAVVLGLTGCGGPDNAESAADPSTTATTATAGRALTWEEFRTLGASASQVMESSAVVWDLTTNRVFVADQKSVNSHTDWASTLSPECSTLLAASGWGTTQAGEEYLEAQWKRSDQAGEAFVAVWEGTDKASTTRYWSECVLSRGETTSARVEDVVGVPMDVIVTRIQGTDVSVAVAHVGEHLVLGQVTGEQTSGLAAALVREYVTGAVDLVTAGE